MASLSRSVADYRIASHMGSAVQAATSAMLHSGCVDGQLEDLEGLASGNNMLVGLQEELDATSGKGQNRALAMPGTG